jgi:threonine dehydratase
MALPTFAGVAEASARLRPYVVRTPLLEATGLNALLHRRRGVRARVLVKAESLQHTGAFKFRGALNRVLHLDEAARARGVVAFSSGNFAQALALAAGLKGVRCTIVAPHDAPSLKLERTRALGAEVRLSRPAEGENREIAAAAEAARFAEESGATLLHPFDDAEVVHGQGTLALEAFEQAADALSRPAVAPRVAGATAGGTPPAALTARDGASTALDTLVVPCGGGGMLAGCVLAAQGASPRTRVVAVEPEGYDDHVASLRTGARTPLRGPPATTVCDALQASAPGELTWAINGTGVAAAGAASDAAAIDAMRVALSELKLVLEPSGALALAALLDPDGPVSIADGACVGVVACGGNVAPDDYARFLGGAR